MPTDEPASKVKASAPTWEALYHSAVLELNPQKLVNKILAAETACQERRKADRQYVAVTDGVCKLLGYSRNDLIGKTIDEITAPEIVNAVPTQYFARCYERAEN